MPKQLIKGFLKECRKGGEPRLKTSVECVLDTESLCFHFEAEQDFPSPKHASYNAALYEGDILEVLLSLESRNHYLEIEINQYNGKYCVLIKNPSGEGDIEIEKIPCIFTSKSYGGEKLWLCDVEISLSELEKLGFSLENAYINIHRQDFERDGYLALYSYYPTLCDSFHKVKAFGKLIQ